jgi:RND family efflux transporter MFP subunit
MSQTTLLLLIFSCVALLYCINILQQTTRQRHVLALFKYCVVLLVVPVTLSSCHSSEDKDKEAKDTTAVATPVTEVCSLQKGKLSASLNVPGELVAFQQVDLYAKVNSFVKKLYVDVGSEVSSGQLLATMEAPEITSQMAGAESRLKAQEALYTASKANYDRLYETSKTPGTVSQNDLDQAMAKKNADYQQLEAARAAYREIGDTKNYLEIRAPFGGVISARNVNAGAYVGPAGKGSEFPLFTLQEQKLLRLVISVPEAYTSYLNQKRTVIFTVTSLPDKKFTASIKRLAGSIDSKLRSERVEMDVQNNNKELLPGMVAEVNLALPAEDSTFIVPKTALVSSTEKVFVIKVSNNKAEWIDVKKGREANGKVEVYGSLKENDSIIIKATDEIRNGSVIQQTKIANKL